MKSIYAMVRRDGAVKVGMSKDPQARSTAVASYIKQPVIVAFFSEVRRDADIVEKTAHKLLAEKQLRGEWFTVTVDEAKAAIERAISIVDGLEEDVTTEIKFKRTDLSKATDPSPFLHMRIPDDVKSSLEKAAKMDDRSVASLVTRLIKEHCEKVGTLEPMVRQ